MNDLKPKTAPPVLRHHRLAVLKANGYTEEWLAERPTHAASRWLENGEPTGPGNYNVFAQAMADMEAAGLQDREAYTKGLRQILDRVDRAIADELGHRESDPPDARYANVDGELVEALDRLAVAFDRDATESAEQLVLKAAQQVTAVWRKLYLVEEGKALPRHRP